MKKFDFKKLLPHLIAILIFIAVSVIYCAPALKGKVLQQNDVNQWKGAIQNSVDYAAKHQGKYPLWTNGVFSGMPAVQIGGVENNNYISKYVNTLLSLNLPKPINFFFLASVCFYILCITFRINPYAGIIGSLGFAFATYNPIIISIGHDTKMHSIAYMPAVLAGILLIYEKKYWLGAVLTTLFTSAMIAVNHLQIDYYLFFTIGIATVFYIIQWIKAKDFKHLLIAGVLAIAATGIGMLTNAALLMGTYEYQKETTRGGESALTDITSTFLTSKTGLNKNYVFSYSMEKTEPLVILFPKMYGGSSDKEEIAEEKSRSIKVLNTLPQDLEKQLPMHYYWGGMTRPGEAGTSGPPYAGAIICFLALLSLFIKDNKHKWWIFTAIGIAILMSWGSYFDGFNSILYNYLPFYNKFRAPAMILVVTQLLLPFAAVLFVNSLFKVTFKKELKLLFQKGVILMGAIFTFAFIIYLVSDFTNGNENSIRKQLLQINQPQLQEKINSFFTGLKEDRQSLMIGSILRSLGFIVVAAGLIYLHIKNIIKPALLSAGLSLFAFFDVLFVDTLYLNNNNYQEKEESKDNFILTKGDQNVLSDTTDYRVFNVSAGAFQDNFTSYFFKSIGGYHPAKIRIYQDLIERQLSTQQIKIPLLNMLNTKYLFIKDPGGLTLAVQKNDGALGPCWLVKQIIFVKNADEEMKALDNFNPKDTAYVQESFKPQIPFLPEADSSATIHLVKNDNDIINYNFSAAKNQFAIFSEIYYTAGWKAFIDGKETPIVKVNYVLRGLAVPSGKHSIEFAFNPPMLRAGKQISIAAHIMVLVLLLVFIFSVYRKKEKPILL